jgi:hypothetical protein
MAKNIVKLNESDLMRLIRNTVTRILKEDVDELSPEFLIHAAHAAAADKKKHPGRGKDSKDPILRAKRDRQIAAFGDRAAELINQDMDNPDFLAIGDRGARRMMYAKGPNSAYLTNDIDDLDNVKIYNDDYAEGDEPLTVSRLSDDEREKIANAFGKFKGYHDRAKELDDKYLEEIVRKAVKKVIKESNFGIDPAAKMLYVSGERDGGVIAFDPKTRRKAFIPREEILSNNPEDIIRVSAGTFAKYFG